MGPFVPEFSTKGYQSASKRCLSTPSACKVSPPKTEICAVPALIQNWKARARTTWSVKREYYAQVNTSNMSQSSALTKQIPSPAASPPPPPVATQQAPLTLNPTPATFWARQHRPDGKLVPSNWPQHHGVGSLRPSDLGV